MKPSKISAFLILLILPFSLSSQVITILDQQTGKSVENVLLYNKAKTATAISDINGKVDITIFKQSKSIIFRHPSYLTLELDYADILLKHKNVKLNERLIDLDEIVVSANSWEVNKKEVPNRIEVIKSKDIAFSNPASSAEMFEKSGEVFVQKSQLGGGSPMIRGFAANKILFVVDGVRMNNAIYRSGNLQNILQADVNSIGSAEIIFGPGTNLYGSDALGGVMDIHILSPVLNNSKQWTVTGEAFARTASAAFEKTGHLKLNIANHKWGFLTLISFSDFDDLKMGSNGNDFYLRNNYVTQVDGIDSIVENGNPLIQKFSGYQQFNFTQKAKLNIDNYSSLNFNLYYSCTSDVPRYDRLNQYKNNSLKYAEWFYNPQKWLMGSIRYTNHKSTSLADNYKITLAYQNVSEGRNDRKYDSEWLRRRVENVQAYSLNLDFDKSLGNRQVLYYGAESVFNYVRSTGEKNNIFTNETTPVATRYPDGGTNYLLTGFYVTYKKNVNNIPLTLQAGSRVSYSYLNSTFVDTSWYHLPYKTIELSNGAVTGNIGIVYHPETLKISLNLSSGFRTPNLDDVAKVFDSEPGNVVIPNENLKPEYLYNIDISLNKTFSNIFKISATGFYSYLNNAMVRRDFRLNGADSMMYDGEMSNIQAVVNAGYGYIYGVSGKFSVQINRFLAFNISANYIKGFDDRSFALRHVSPFLSLSSFVFELEKLRLELSGIYNGEISYNNLSPTERDKTDIYLPDKNGNPYSPAWGTLNFRGSYAFSHTFLLTMGVENILNRRYRPYSSGITAPGINFIVALKVTF